MRVCFGIAMAASAAPLLAAGACSSFGSSDPSPAASDASNAPDASDVADAFVPERDAAAPTPDARSPPLRSENFEVDQGACGQWTGKNTTSVERVADAGTDGSFGCRFCSATSSPNVYFSVRTPLGPASGPPQPAYFIEANVRFESGDPATGLVAAVDVDGVFYPGSEANGAGWHHVTQRTSADAGVPVIGVVAGRIATGPACLVVDDIVVRKVD